MNTTGEAKDTQVNPINADATTRGETPVPADGRTARRRRVRSPTTR